ncbi:hypothetical protein KP509_25G047100 [Ceratopteris richardii]|uniref:Uncharacterized protein n=1 Tax=Ceratopteris richardii TaxID=49495 RepID=A0A8T2RPZ6_CERRI|nr:hypothetical protein KP509_25G047100 [Ceratopteris richardii]
MCTGDYLDQRKDSSGLIKGRTPPAMKANNQRWTFMLQRCKVVFFILQNNLFYEFAQHKVHISASVSFYSVSFYKFLSLSLRTVQIQMIFQETILRTCFASFVVMLLLF